MHGFAGGSLPNERRFALVGDADGRDGVPTEPRGRERAADGDAHTVPDLVRLVLDPTRLWKMLGKLACRAAERSPFDVHDEHGGPSGALVDSEKMSRHVGRRLSRRCAAWCRRWCHLL